MSETVFVRTFDSPALDISDILRYAGCRDKTKEIEALLNECLIEALPILTYRVCYTLCDVACADGVLKIGKTVVQSESLGVHLDKCGSAVLFAATVGIGLDRLIARYSRISPSRAVLLQAIGAQRVESLCESFEDFICGQYGLDKDALTRRFSPGYGDLALSFQQDIFSLLDCSRKIGLTLNKNLLMSPTKSVTAIVGIRK